MSPRKSCFGWGTIGVGIFILGSLFHDSHVLRSAPVTGWILQAFGAVLFLFAALRRDTPDATPGVAAGLLGLLGPLLFLLLGEKGWTPGVLTTLAGVGALLALRMPFFRRLCFGLAFLGTLSLGQIALAEFFERVAITGHSVPRAGAAIAWLVRLCGQDVAYSGGAIHLPLMPRLLALSLDLEKLEVLTFAYFLWAIVLRHFFCRAAFSDTASRVAALVVYLPLRATLMILFYLWGIQMTPYFGPLSNVNVFWDRWIAFASFLPLLLLFRGFPLWRPPAISGKRALVPVLAITVSAVFLAAAVNLEIGEEAKGGRILVDEFHSQWERTDRPMDTEWYGRDSGYNFHSIFAYLRHFYDVELSSVPLTDKLLKGADVLILKTPTEAFSTREIDAVEKFVRAGGGLFLIGDHTNVFGTSTFLNPIARRAGFVFRYDAILHVEDEFIILDHPLERRYHPVLEGVEEFFFQTSCSIQSLSFPWHSAAMPGRGLKAQTVDYRQDNFFPKVVNAPDMEFGVFNRLHAGRWGRGRVVGFSDSTVFSNFAAFLPGRRELFMNSVAWTSGRGGWDGWRPVAGWGALAVAAVLFMLLGFSGGGLRLTLALILAVLAFEVSSSAFHSASRVRFQHPARRKRPVMVVYDHIHSSWELPVLEYTKDARKSIQLFSQWTLRLGYFYRVAMRTLEDPSGCDLLVLGRLKEPMSPAVVKDHLAFLEGGGRMLLLLGRGGFASHADSLLEAVGLRRESGGGAETVGVVDSEVTWNVEGFLPLSGGKPLLTGPSGAAALVRQDVGKGRIYVCSLLDEFFDEKMGKSDSTIPDADLRHHFSLVYGIMEGAVTGRDREALTKYGSRLESETSDD